MVREWILDRTLRILLWSNFPTKVINRISQHSEAHRQRILRSICNKDTSMAYSQNVKPPAPGGSLPRRTLGTTRKTSIFNTKSASTWSHTTDLKLPTASWRYFRLKDEKKAGIAKLFQQQVQSHRTAQHGAVAGVRARFENAAPMPTGRTRPCKSAKQCCCVIGGVSTSALTVRIMLLESLRRMVGAECSRMLKKITFPE